MSNLQRVFLYKSREWLDISITLNDLKYVIKHCSDLRIKRELGKIVDEATKDFDNMLLNEYKNDTL